MGAKVFYLSEQLKLRDLRDFASELLEAWAENKHELVDSENKWWQDDIELGFYQDMLDFEGLSDNDKNYVMYCLGY